jgi:hypothetical protein
MCIPVYVLMSYISKTLPNLSGCCNKLLDNAHELGPALCKYAEISYQASTASVAFEMENRIGLITSADDLTRVRSLSAALLKAGHVSLPPAPPTPTCSLADCSTQMVPNPLVVRTTRATQTSDPTCGKTYASVATATVSTPSAAPPPPAKTPLGPSGPKTTTPGSKPKSTSSP